MSSATEVPAEAPPTDEPRPTRIILVWQTVVRPYLIEHASMPSSYAIHMRAIDEDMRPAELPFRSDPDAFYGNRHYANLLMTQIFVEQRVRRRHQQLHRELEALLRLLASGRSPAVH